jgi:hypothetical protein
VLDLSLDNLVKYELKVVNLSGNTLYVAHTDLVKKEVTHVATINPDQFQDLPVWQKNIPAESSEKNEFYGFNVIKHNLTRVMGTPSMRDNYVYIVNHRMFGYIISKQVGRKVKLLEPIINCHSLLAGFSANFDINQFAVFAVDNAK